MIKKPNKKMIGIFTFTGILMFFTILFYFIGTKIFINKENVMVMFFKESIQGLKIGSPVVFKGVEIGKVVEINLIDKRNTESLDFDIPVYISITNKIDNIKNKRKILEELIEKRGLRARLSTYSYITGQLMIEFVISQNSEAVLLNKIKNIPEVPTILSSKGELSEGLKNIPIKDIFNKLDVLLTTMNKYMPSILYSVDDITKDINKVTNSDLNKEVVYNLNETIETFNSTLKSIKNLTDYLERHPDALLKGKKE